MFHPFNENREDGNGVTRTYTVFDALSCSPNGVEVWKTLSDGTPTFTDITLSGLGKFADGSGSAPSITFTNDTDTGLYSATANQIGVATGGTARFVFTGSAGAGLQFKSDLPLSWSSGNVGSASDIFLVRDAAAVLAQRNGTNAQAFRIYNTFTDASNYERGIFSWSGNALNIGTQQAGTGTARTLGFIVGGTSVWFIPSTGHLLATTDNTYDIGASAATRPRQLYLAGALNVGSTKVNPISDGVISLTNAAGTDFTRLQFGGTTSSFPSLKRVSARLEARLADDTGNADLRTRTCAIEDGVTAPSAVAGYAQIYVDTADGDLKVIFGDGVVKTIVVDV